ncbi:MAG: M28 family peptidase [Chitinophagaceae bacterium]|nr:M28 family peptidase [Chitinophagaceae bacterium]
MISPRTKTLLVLLFVSVAVSAQKLKKADKLTLANLKTHVAFLADDKLEGRRAGTNGEKLAMEYIKGQFETIGLLPKGTDGFYQAFEINEGKQIGPGTYLKINNASLEAGKDFFPFPFSFNKKIDATPAIAIQEADMPWFVDLAETLEENKSNPHFDLNEYIRNNSKKAADRGATAVILFNSSATDDKLVFNGKDKSDPVSIPVIYVSKDAANKYFKDKTATVDIKLKTEIGEKKRTGHNVAGYIDNGAASTVILGAHFDHLGYGEDGNSMMRTGEKLIHNGADDNASGSAALIELARILKGSKTKTSNYLFVAFSGEELGLFGSKYYADNPTIDLKSVNYMLNMDMVGRLNDSTKVLSVGGYGTSPTWASVVTTEDKKLPFVVKTDSSGSGPSDHTSFYRKDIPVLFFFTGQHRDYHRPSDDADKINYMGELNVVNYIYSIINTLNKENQKLAFLKTREPQMGTRAFSVTMGIMPDYTFSGTGVRADGVTEGRPAFKAGLKAGDIIIQIGEYSISSVETYMQTLGKFKKGDKTKVKFKRGNETIEAPVEF